jgi:AcrR family transcriptional regulator
MTRVNRRLEQPRELVLSTMVEMVGEQGLAKVTIAALAERLGTSGGHLLYYFGTRDGLVLEALRWSEQRYAEQRAPLMAEVAGRPPAAPPDPRPLLAFADVYLPVDARDARWLLWLGVWARAPYDPDLATAQEALDEAWHTDLTRLLAGVLPGLPDPDGVSTRLRAMWDGFAVQVVTGGGAAARETARAQTLAAVGR